MPIPVNEAMVDRIASTGHWNSATITYAIGLQGPGANNQADAQTDIGSAPVFAPVSPSDLAAIEAAATLWDELIAPSLVETTTAGANITVDQVTTLPTGAGGVTYSTYTNYSQQYGDYPFTSAGVYLDTNALTIGGNYDWNSAVHEFGHALGLVHPGRYNAGATQPTYENNRTYDEDTGLFSIMSYFEPSNYDATINWTRTYILTPMIYDILAIQKDYGADTTTRTGDTTYGFNTKATDFANADELAIFSFEATTHAGTMFTVHPHVFTIWDAGGAHDRIDASGFVVDQRIDLTSGSYSDIGEIAIPDSAYPPADKIFKQGTLIDSVGIAFGVTIEEAIGGSGNDTITGNFAANYLEGGDGNDTLYGGGLNDTLIGGLGDDRLDGGGALDGGGGVPGPDMLTGGGGADTFVYGTHYRTTVITDYDVNSDLIDFTNFKSIHSFADLLTYAKQSGADTLLDFGDPYVTGGIGDTLLLQNVTLADLDPANMVFSEETKNPVPTAFALVANAYATQTNRSFQSPTAPLTDGGFVAVVSNIDTYYSGGYFTGHRFDSSGLETGTFRVNTTPTASYLGDAEVIGLLDGSFAVVWASGTNVSDRGSSIRARLFNSDGTPKGDDFEIAPEGAGGSISYWQASSSGGFVVEWIDGSTSYSLQRAHGVGVTSDGAVVGTVDEGPVYEERTTNGYSYLVRVYNPWGDSTVYGPVTFYYHLHNGDLLAVTSTTTDTGGSYDVYTTHIYAEVLGKTGVVDLTPNGGALDYASGYQGSPPAFSVSELADDRILISWRTGTHDNQFGSFDATRTGGTASVILEHDLLGFTSHGTAGDDIMRGGPSRDHLYGLGGNDTFFSGLGADVLDGGDGIDTVDYSRSLQGVDVNFAVVGRTGLGGHAEGDTYVSIENITGSAYADYLIGNDGDNVIKGGSGDDHLFGEGGADTLEGGKGKDTLRGGGGADTLDGGAGDDTLYGEGGANRFVYKTGYGFDTIEDFNRDGGDWIDLSGVAGMSTFAAIKEHFNNNGTGTYISFGRDIGVFLTGINADSLRASDFGLPDSLSLSASALVARLPTLDPAKVASIEITGTDHNLALRASQVALYAALLAKITTPYTITVSDTALHVAANLDALQANGNVTTITFAPGATLNVTANQLYYDRDVLSRITNTTYRIIAPQYFGGKEILSYNAAGHSDHFYLASGTRYSHSTYNLAGYLTGNTSYDYNGQLSSIAKYDGTANQTLTSYVSYFSGTTKVQERYTGAITGKTYDASDLTYDQTGLITSKAYYKDNGLVSSTSYYFGTTDIQSTYTGQITGQSYTAIARTYDPGKVLATQILYNNDGTVAQTGYGDNRTLTTNFYTDDTLRAPGQNETFVVNGPMGHDTITNFRATGTGHDTLVFETAYGNNVGDANWLLSNYATAASSNSVLFNFDANNSVLVKGVSLATLQANAAQDIAFASANYG